MAQVSHTTDNFTSRAILFSGIEVKPENGDQKEAELQMAIWMAASLRKKMDLARTPLFKVIVSQFGVGNRTPLIPAPTALLEPALTIIGHEHKVYYAYPSSEENGNITILGPDEKLADLSTRSVEGIFKLIRLYGSILNYGSHVE